MSKHEDELRRRLAVDGDDVFDTLYWFLDATGFQAHIDGGPMPDWSEFEREFLAANLMRYHQRYHDKRLEGMSEVEKLNEWATEWLITPHQPPIDMSTWTDRQVVEQLDLRVPAPTRNVASALEELTRRANAKCMTVGNYIVGLIKASKLPVDEQIEDIFKVLRRVTDMLAERGYNPGVIAGTALEVGRELTELEAEKKRSDDQS
jgi:hypothetical protein